MATGSPQAILRRQESGFARLPIIAKATCSTIPGLATIRGNGTKGQRRTEHGTALPNAYARAETSHLLSFFLAYLPA